MTAEEGRPGPAHTVEEALASDRSQRRLWFSSAFSILAFVLAFGACLVLHKEGWALSAGLAAMFVVVGAGVVPHGIEIQVGLPTGLCVLLSLPLVLVSDGQPVIAAILTAIVMTLGAVSQADSPIGSVAGVMGPMAFVMGLASRAIREVPVVESLAAAGVGAVAGAIAVAGLVGWRELGRRTNSSFAMPTVPRIPPGAWHRWTSAVGSALRNWRHDPDVRLALRRVVVLVPLVAVVEAWGDDNGLFMLLTAYAVLQPSMKASTSRTITQVLGALAACLAAVTVGLLVHGLLLLVIGILGMAFGLAFTLRNQFLASAGTTAFALAGAGMAGGMTAVAAGRFAATLAAAAIAALGTFLVRPPAEAATPLSHRE